MSGRRKRTVKRKWSKAEHERAKAMGLINWAANQERKARRPCSGKRCPPGPCQKGKTPTLKKRKRKTRGQVVVEIWLRQRGLRRPGAWAKGRDPLPADYAELARRIDSFRERVLKGAT